MDARSRKARQNDPLSTKPGHNAANSLHSAHNSFTNSPGYVSAASSRPPSGPSSPLSSTRGSAVDLPGVAAASDHSSERPAHKRGRSLFSWQHQRPRYGRAKSSLHFAGGRNADNSEIAIQNLPYNAIAQFAKRTQQGNVRMWFLKSRNAMLSRRRTEADKLRELQRSEMLFGQAFSLAPMVVLLAASSLQAEDAHEKRVPVVLQQLGIRATHEQAKHYRNMVRVHLEYGAGLSLIQWEIVRGHRDFLYLRAKLKSQIKRTRTKKLKLPKLPRPKAYGLKEHKPKQHIFNPDSDDDLESDLEMSSDDDGDDYDDSNDDLGEEDNIQGENSQLHQLNNTTQSNETAYNAANTNQGNETNAAANTQGNETTYNTPANTPMMPAEDGRIGSNNRSTSRGGSIRSGSILGSTRPNSLMLGHHHSGRPASFATYAQAIEDWLNRIKEIYALRSDSNYLMQFLELSHLSLKLSAEYSFHGKEGTLIVRSFAKDAGWRVNHYHPRDIKDMIERHTKKWVLVKDSFIVIVDNIYSTRIREVFLADSSFSIKHIEEELDANKEYDQQFGTQYNPPSGQQQAADAMLPPNTENRQTPDFNALSAINAVSAAVQALPAHALPDAEFVHKRKGAKSVFLHIQNNERELKLAALNPRELRRWQASILQMKSLTPWALKHRFDSFAPVRKNVFGQWFVDGRDYMWVLSEALENANDTIFILDWWLSPELYLRRPPEGNQKWRLDRILKRKAEQGVKIFVIVYRNVGPTIPIDSLWTKHSLLDLHENIHVMRSPHQLANKGSLFWAHHEKLCIIDSAVAFNGGIDMCFGRWDTWQHTLTDDASEPFLNTVPTPQEWAEKRTQLFPGKDYSNARVKDFYDLNKPFEDMYDRGNVPRMPWHDIHQMVLGQPARDFARHFVQRWNFVMRQKIPSRPTPLLLPPADFTQEDLERLHLTGTCEYQVLRSSGEWSLGLKKHEQSIQNAYLQLIEESEHLVYIENQFFITSTEVDGVLIENQVGNALVQRIVRAHERGEKWRAFILIPLMPGFEAEVDTDKASSVRVICQCQFNSISRGPHSIFYRLESMGIRPDQYINFFSLRKWGKFSDTPDAPNEGRIVTELLYIHAKCMIVDDRIAIIGSANINERSMRGLRDSEVAVCVRDTKVVESRMAGKPWKAGKFAHSLRVRLMREHLGVDIDKLDIIDRCLDSLKTAVKLRIQQVQEQRQRNEDDYFSNRSTHRATTSHHPHSQGSHHHHNQGDKAQAKSLSEDATNYPDWLYPELHTFNWYAGTSLNKGVRDYKKFSSDSRIQKNPEHKMEVSGEGERTDHYKERQTSQEEQTKFRQRKAASEDLDMEREAKELMNKLLQDPKIRSTDQFKREFYSQFTKIDINRPLKRAGDLPLPQTDEDGLHAVNNENIPIDPWQFDDPLDDRFVNDRWLAAAERNTLIYRLVFRCQPDDEVETWKDYKEFQGHLERFYEKQREDGGPNSLRRKGHHEPDRIDKYVLGGAIKRPDPEVLRQNIKRATDADYYHQQVEQQQQQQQHHEGISLHPRSKPTPGHRPLIQHSPHKKENYNHPDLHKYTEHLKDSMHSKLSNADLKLVSQIERMHMKKREEEERAVNEKRHDKHHDKRRGHHHGDGDFNNDKGVLDEGTEYGFPVNLHNNEKPVREHHNIPPHDGEGNGHAKHSSAANGHSTIGNSMNGKVTNGNAANGNSENGHTVTASDAAPLNIAGGGSNGHSQTNGRADGNKLDDVDLKPVSQDKNNLDNVLAADGYVDAPSSFSQINDDVVAFPPVRQPTQPNHQQQQPAREPTPLRPSVSTTSSRRYAHTINGVSKPARKWGHFEHVLDSQVAEDMLQGVTGNLVVFPTEWLNRELDSGNWNFQLDRIAPLEIYD